MLRYLYLHLLLLHLYDPHGERLPCVKIKVRYVKLNLFTVDILFKSNRRYLKQIALP